MPLRKVSSPLTRIRVPSTATVRKPTRSSSTSSPQVQRIRCSTGRPGAHRWMRAATAASISTRPPTRGTARSRSGRATAQGMSVSPSTSAPPTIRPSGAMVSQHERTKVWGTRTRSTDRVMPPKFHQSDRMAGIRSGSRRLLTWTTRLCDAHTDSPGDLHGERSETADVGGQLLTVEEHTARVVGRREVEESATILGLVHVEQPAVPDGALVVEQVGILRVPVTGDGEGHRGVEVVLHSIGRVPGLEVPEPALAIPVTQDVDVTGLVRVDDGPPLTVERLPGSIEDVGQQDRAGRGPRVQQFAHGESLPLLAPPGQVRSFGRSGRSSGPADGSATGGSRRS